jgi:Zn-dependent protease/CBS domain-containing protein
MGLLAKGGNRMKWSWKIGQIAGVDLRIHATFLVLLGFVGASYWAVGKSANGVVAGVGFILAVFACVVLHELGHAIAARRFGIRTRDVTLLPIGGVARLERMPEEPARELWIALAGPAVNIAIAALLYGWVTLMQKWEPLADLGVATGPFFERLMVANIWLVLFNLIPAFPMDGGRVLRALLASRMTFVKATATAVSVGRWLAFAFGVIGLFTNPMLLLIGLFVWIGATQEANAARVRSVLSGIPARAATLTEFDTLKSNDTLADATRLRLRGPQRDFPVVDEGRLTGLLTESDMLLALADVGEDHPVSYAMKHEFPTAEATDTLEKLFQRMQDCDCHSTAVVSDGRLVGLVTMDHLRELLLIDDTLQRRGALSRFMNWTASREASSEPRND